MQHPKSSARSKTTWIDVDGGRLYVEQAGEGIPLLLMHGWTLDHRMFELQAPRISDCFHVISYDRRGFGRSRALPDLKLELDDIDRIADALSLDTMHLLGMSQGARLALRYAVTRPQRIRSLVLQGAVVDGLSVDEPGRERIPFDEYAELARSGKIDVVRKRWLEHPMMALAPRHKRARRLLEKIVNEYTGADLVVFSPESYAFPLNVLNRLSEFRAPTLLLTGVYELASRRAHAQKLLETIPGSREIIFDQSGHLANLTEPDLYNEQGPPFLYPRRQF